MQKITFLVLLISFGASLSYVCPQVFKWGKTTDTKTCIAYDKESSTPFTAVYNINTCPANFFCSFDLIPSEREDEKCKEKSKSRELLDGMACQENKQCFSKICSAGKCKGKAKKEQCKTFLDCKVGLTCLDLQCVDLIKIGEYCTIEYDCVLGSSCNLETHQCQEIFSLKDGEESNNSRFCKSGQTAFFDGKQLCTSLTLKDEPECKGGDNECTYIAQGKKGQFKEVRYRCRCSHAYPNRTFCPIPLNDPVPQMYIKKLKEMKNVHSFNREILKTVEDRELVFRAQAEFTGVDDRIIRLMAKLPYPFSNSELGNLAESARNNFFLK